MNPKIRAVLKTVLGPAKRICETEVFWVRRHIVLAPAPHRRLPAPTPIAD
jgi:hypothetical protein